MDGGILINEYINLEFNERLEEAPKDECHRNTKSQSIHENKNCHSYYKGSDEAVEEVLASVAQPPLFYT